MTAFRMTAAFRMTGRFIMFALWNRADHYIFMLWFVLLLLLFVLA